jgi:hypothetical protein
MPLQSTGAISLSNIQTEFGGSNPISLNEYYRLGEYTTSNNTGVPTSGLIGMSSFYGTSFLPMSATYLTSLTSATNSSSYTFSNANLGAAAATREIFVAVSSGYNASTAGTPIVGATIAGITATVHNNGRFGLVSATVPTGTSGNIVINFSGTSEGVSLAVFRVINRRVANAGVFSTTTIGSSFQTSITTNHSYPARSFGILAGTTITQSGGGTANSSFAVGSRYTKVGRISLNSGQEAFCAYMLPSTTLAETITFSLNFNTTGAIGSSLYIIQ